MNIIFDFKIFLQQNYGGPSRYFFNLFEYINKKQDSNNAYIISPVYFNEYLDLSNFKDKIIGTKFPKIKFSGVLCNRINRLLSNIFIKKSQPSIIHTTDYQIYSKRKEYPLIVTVHDLIHEIYHEEFGKKKDFRPKKKILEISDHIICVSQNTKRDLMRYYDVDEKKVSVVYHGNNFQNFIHNKKNPIFQFKYFLYVGGRKRYKNFFSVIEAFKKNKQIYNEYKIICVGGGKFLESEKKKLIENDFDLRKIIFLDRTDDNDLFNLYKNATALIYPSFYEGFGMPIIEAMSLGCPVISSNTSSLTEVFGDAAISFSPSSIKELTNNLEKIAFDDDLKRKVIDLGYKQSKKFTWERCIDKTLTIYNKVI